MRSRIPTLLTLARMAAAPLVGALLALGEGWALWATVVFAAAAATDYLDGLAARRLGAATRLGAILDPVADKVLVVGTIMVLAQVRGADLAVALPSLVIVAREIVVSGLREGLAESGAGRLPVTWAAKCKTAVQMVALGVLLPGIESVAAAGVALLWLGAALAVLSGWGYARSAARQAAATP